MNKLDLDAINQAIGRSHAMLIHDQAMTEADLAFTARQEGREHDARAHAERAMQSERTAASMVESEPSRSVLLRSAATLARDAGQFREAERLIARALAKDPPRAIADELRALWKEILPSLEAEG